MKLSQDQRDEALVSTIIGLILLFLSLAFGTPVKAAEVEAMGKLTHGSDIARGCPQSCDEYEPQYDSLTGGITITAGKAKAWEIDLSHGFKWIDRGPREGASEFSVRFYPGRIRKWHSR